MQTFNMKSEILFLTLLYIVTVLFFLDQQYRSYEHI